MQIFENEIKNKNKWVQQKKYEEKDFVLIKMLKFKHGSFLGQFIS